MLTGEWLLTKDKGEANWHLTKVGEPMKPVSERKTDESALTGRTMEQIAAERDKEWQSNRSPSATVCLPEKLGSRGTASANVLTTTRTLPPALCRWSVMALPSVRLRSFPDLVFKGRGVFDASGQREPRESYKSTPLGLKYSDGIFRVAQPSSSLEIFLADFGEYC